MENGEHEETAPEMTVITCSGGVTLPSLGVPEDEDAE